MKRSDLRKPLVQSALILLAVFLLIGFVAGSNANSIATGIASMFKGAFLTVLFVFALVVGVVVSIALLVGIYLAAVALYSPQAAGDSYGKLKVYLLDYVFSWSSDFSKRIKKFDKDPTPSATSRPHDYSGTSPDTAQDPELREQLSRLDSALAKIQEDYSNLSAQISDLKAEVTNLPLDTITSTTEELGTRQEEFSASLAALHTRLEEMTATAERQDGSLSQYRQESEKDRQTLEQLSAELATLRNELDAKAEEKTAQGGQEDEEGPRLFVYIEDKQQQEQLRQLVDDAIDREMTYAEIDDFLTQSLPKDIDTILKEHPSLTKDYIRMRKNSK